ncbi:MAG: DAK2 domain-containing protein, partial [Oscillospiraceae bacterium]|nr:DAK2 domain-containing protein [Oscillospiraceae bacterium]
VDHIVKGGQTMNPSTDDILHAVEATPARHVFILPNNKNIIMAAEQTINLTDRVVKVLPTRTIPQGLTAMLNFDPDLSAGENEIAMNKAADRVGTGQITFAARDSDFEGRNIKAGELLALENGKLSFTDVDLTHATLKLTKNLLKRDSAFVTLILGEDVSDEQGAQLEAALAEKLPSDVELSVVKGGQPVYYCIISVE